MKRAHPLLRALCGPALFEEILADVERIPLDKTYSRLPSGLSRGESGDFFDLVRPRRLPDTLVVANAFVSPRGLIFRGARLLRRSNFYAYLKLRDVWRERPRRDVEIVGEAAFVSQQLVYKGSYGDYWDEFLATYCARRPEPAVRVLLADNFARAFAEEDLAEAGVGTIPVGARGVRVRRLHILPPAQFFNNYLPETIASLHAAFPGRHVPPAGQRRRGRRVYLSRRGFERPGFSCGGRVNRVIANEEEVERALAGAGFCIVHPHALTNREVREALAGAETVVAPHGAALFHTVWSPPRTVVELAHPDWFLPSFMKLCHAMGVSRHRIVVAVEGRVPIPALLEALDDAR